jgi:transcriptional regulator with XRE-family HTH domain
MAPWGESVPPSADPSGAHLPARHAGGGSEQVQQQSIGMFEIGASLREARTRRGLTAEDVQKAIRIRDRYLTALEQEDWELLPGDAYTKGFLRAYAEYLGLDGNLYVDEFNSRYARRDEHPFMPEPLAPIGPRSVGLLRPLAAIGIVAAVVAGIAAWQLSRSTGTSGSAGTRQGGGARSTPASKPERPAKTQTSHTKTRAVQPATTPARATLVAARGRVWLLVRAGGPTGEVIFEGVLEQGKTLPISLSRSPKVWVRIGAPWALDVRVGGKRVGGLPARVGNVYLSASGLAPG